MSAGGVQWRRGYESPSPGRRTPEQIRRYSGCLLTKWVDGASSIGGNWYTLIVRDGCTRFTRLYFLGKTLYTASAFELFLAEVREDGTPSAVMAVRSDNRGEPFGGHFGKLMPQAWYQARAHASKQPQVQRCSQTSIGND